MKTPWWAYVILLAAGADIGAVFSPVWLSPWLVLVGVLLWLAAMLLYVRAVKSAAGRDRE